MRAYGGYDEQLELRPRKERRHLGGDDAMKDADGYAIGGPAGSAST